MQDVGQAGLEVPGGLRELEHEGRVSEHHQAVDGVLHAARRSLRDSGLQEEPAAAGKPDALHRQLQRLRLNLEHRLSASV